MTRENREGKAQEKIGLRCEIWMTNGCFRSRTYCIRLKDLSELSLAQSSSLNDLLMNISLILHFYWLMLWSLGVMMMTSIHLFLVFLCFNFDVVHSSYLLWYLYWFSWRHFSLCSSMNLTMNLYCSNSSTHFSYFAALKLLFIQPYNSYSELKSTK